MSDARDEDLAAALYAAYARGGKITMQEYTLSDGRFHADGDKEVVGSVPAKPPWEELDLIEHARWLAVAVVVRNSLSAGADLVADPTPTALDDGNRADIDDVDLGEE